MNVKRLTSEAAKEPRVDPNASLPTLADQLSQATASKPPESVAGRVDAPQLGNGTNDTNDANDATALTQTPTPTPTPTPTLTPTLSLNPKRPDKDLGDLNVRFSENSGRFATDEEVRQLNSRLVIEDPDNGEEHVMFGGTAELYLADNLRNLYHSFENNSPLPDPRTHPLTSKYYPQGRDHFSNILSVVRHGGKTFDDFFGDAKISMPLLIKFVLEHGETNDTRDGILNDEDGNGIQRRRVVNGSCGRAQEGERVEGHAAPASTYGFDVFDKEKDPVKREKIKTMFGSLLDIMQECEDYIEQVELKNPPPFWNKARDKRFAEKIRLLLNCRFTRREDFTIQLKNITQGERTWKHKDQWNCTWNGYTKTLTLCFIWVDAKGELWSWKIVANSRFKAGNFLEKVYKLPPMLTRMRSSMKTLDNEYKLLMHTQREQGGHQYPNGLTHKTFQNLVLDACCPWTAVDIGNGVSQKLMKFTAGPVRDIQLSAPTTIVYKYHQHKQDVRKAVELAFHLGYLPGYCRAFHLGQNRMDDLLGASSPSLKMFLLAEELFVDEKSKLSPLGDYQSGRWSPSAIQYRDVFLNEDGTMNGVMEKVVDGLVGVLEWIENNKHDPAEFHHAGIEARVQQCVDDWKNIASKQRENGPEETKCLEGLAKLDFGEFRMMLAIQICCLAKVVVTGHANLNNLVYPVSGLGARGQLDHLKTSSDRQEVIVTIVCEMEMEEYGTNAAEGLLCETSLGRVEVVFDFVFYGQMLFKICKDGKNWLKAFGESEWEEF